MLTFKMLKEAGIIPITLIIGGAMYVVLLFLIFLYQLVLLIIRKVIKKRNF
jgi:hypothetical protein